MMKTTAFLIVIYSVFSASLSAETYYSQGARYVTSGSNWNTASDGTGSAGNSSTYQNPEHDLILQKPVDYFFWSGSTEPVDPFNAKSYALQDGVVFRTRSTSQTEYATFNGGDITVDAGATVSILNGATVDVGTSAGGFKGTANFNLAKGTTLVLDDASSKATGLFDFGLNVVGDGLIDLVFANENCDWLFSGLTSDFTGELRGDTFNGSIQVAAGTEALNASLRLGRSTNDRTGKLDLRGNFAFGSVEIDGISLANGAYTYDDLVALNGGIHADNLIDNGGTLFVGQEIPAALRLFVIH